MGKKKKFVDCQEEISIKVGKWLSQNGLSLVPSVSVVIPSVGLINPLGFMRFGSEAKTTNLFGIVTRKTKRSLGTICFDNGIKGDSERSWIIEVYGQRYLRLARILVEEMSFAFKAEIALFFIPAQPYLETQLFDDGAL